jgi:hypothetical protein
MSDSTPEPAATHPPKPTDGATIDGDVVPPDSAQPVATGSEPVYDLVEVAPAVPSVTEPVVATGDPGAAEIPEPVSAPTPAYVETAPLAATSAASMQTVYVPAPVPPRMKGNRGFGTLIALGATVVFAGLYALVIAMIRAVEVGVFQFNFFGSLAFYTPAIFFFVGFVIVVLLANRASWWGYVLGSLFVGLFVYFGTVATGLLVSNIVAETPSGAARLLATALTSPFIIAAALLAREVSMWMGAAISVRGRRVKARNLETREAFDRESAERTAEYENSRYGTRETAV